MGSAVKTENQRINLPVALACLLQPAPQPPSAGRPLPESQPRAVLLLDIDGVVRDVAASYRRALAETVHHYGGWRPDSACVDALKAEGRWNNDWDASLELLRRRGLDPLPEFSALVAVFSGFYFGGNPDGDPAQWRGFIGDEALLLDRSCFEQLSAAGIAWGFVSGAEPASARYVLETRLGLTDPPLVAMGDAPDKPDPTGLLRLAGVLGGSPGRWLRRWPIWGTRWPMCSPCTTPGEPARTSAFSASPWRHPTCTANGRLAAATRAASPGPVPMP